MYFVAEGNRMKMQRAEMEFVAFDTRDVITTSGDIRIFTVSGLFDGKNVNASFVDSNGAFSYKETSAYNISWAFSHHGLGDLEADGTTIFESLDGEQVTASNLFISRNDNTSVPEQAERWNGIYQWLNDTFRRIL